MATISLGSQTVFHYYRYDDAPFDSTPDSPTPPAKNSEIQTLPSSKARPINPNPVASVLLEPRSLIITTNELYSSHLHGIDGIGHDLIAAHPASLDDGSPRGRDSEDLTAAPVRVANWNMLGSDNKEITRVVKDGGVLQRQTRTSLTCRVVERTAQLPRISGPTRNQTLDK